MVRETASIFRTLSWLRCYEATDLRSPQQNNHHISQQYNNYRNSGAIVSAHTIYYFVYYIFFENVFFVFIDQHISFGLRVRLLQYRNIESSKTKYSLLWRLYCQRLLLIRVDVNIVASVSIDLVKQYSSLCISNVA